MNLALAGDFDGAESLLMQLLRERGIAPNELINQCYRALVKRRMDRALKVELIDALGETDFRLLRGKQRHPDRGVDRPVCSCEHPEAVRRTMEKAPELHQGDRTDDWGRFLKSRYKKELGEISRLYPHKRSLLIDYRQIERFGKAGIILADELLENPGKVLEDVWDAIKNNQLIRAKDGKEPKGVNIRFTNLPRKNRHP